MQPLPLPILGISKVCYFCGEMDPETGMYGDTHLSSPHYLWAANCVFLCQIQHGFSPPTMLRPLASCQLVVQADRQMPPPQ